jgi:hypothetical protein
MSRFAIQQFRCNGASSYYSGVRSIGFDRGPEIEPQGTDGTDQNTAHHAVQYKPGCEITSRSLKTMATLMPTTRGVPMLALDASVGLVMILGKGAANAPGYNSGSVHLTRAALRGVIYMAGLSWAKRQKAEARIRGMFISSNGTAASITEASNAALPTLPTPDLGFTLQSIVIAGATITNLDSLKIDIDPHFEWDYTAGLPEPTSIMGAGVSAPVDTTLEAELGDCDLGAGTGTVVATFTRFAHGGGLASDQLIATLNGNWSVEESLGGDSGSPAKRKLKVRTIYDGTNFPLALATA